ncbi:MAG: DUF2804 domain-containing protein [Spirochaetaceae bacterium]|jgi:hypothetical protein|nr:DUF2804 domain-containing protein [Spirochaetaceae bacterium]
MGGFQHERGRILYTRNVTRAPEGLIKNGSPVFGTFADVPENLDIRGVRRPFASVPLPPIITNGAIRSNLTCMFNTGRLVCSVDLFSAFFFSFAEIVFWDQGTHKKSAYRTVVGPKSRFIPRNLHKGAVVNFNRRRKFRLSWDRKRGYFSFVCKLRGDALRPDVQGAFSANLRAPSFGEVCCVLPAPVMRRCRAVYKASAPIKGTFGFTSNRRNPGQKDAVSFSGGIVLYDLHRAYYKFRTRNEYAYGIGQTGGREIAFSLVATSLESVNPEEYNENFLFVDGKTTFLPPIRITYPFGITDKWVIQDTESMVDLSFTPQAVHTRNHSLFVLSARYYLIFGTFTGALLTQDGSEIALKDFPGIVKKHFLRL